MSGVTGKVSLVFEHGEWRIPCIQWQVDLDGKPIEGTSIKTTMSALKAAAALMSYVGNVESEVDHEVANSRFDSVRYNFQNREISNGVREDD